MSQADTVTNGGHKYWKEPAIVPECLLSHLTTCSLRNYSRINCEFQFANYIIRNSIVLSTMIIQCAESVETNTKHQMFMELSSLCPRISATTCQLLFIWTIMRAIAAALSLLPINLRLYSFLILRFFVAYNNLSFNFYNICKIMLWFVGNEVWLWVCIGYVGSCICKITGRLRK